MDPQRLYLACLRAAILDVYARRWAVCTGLADLMEKGGSYRPSLYPGRYANAQEVQELRDLADGYDAAQTLRGDPRRACRGDASWWHPEKPRAQRKPVPPRQPRRERTAQLDLPKIPALHAGAAQAMTRLRKKQEDRP